MGTEFRTNDEEVVLRTNGYRYFSIALLLAGAVLFSIGDRPLFMRLVSVMFLGLTVRGYRLALLVSHGKVKIRGWLYSRTIPFSDILQVEVGSYAGVWTGGGTLFFVDELVLLRRISLARTPVHAVIGLHSKGKVELIATRLRELMAGKQGETSPSHEETGM